MTCDVTLFAVNTLHNMTGGSNKDCVAHYQDVEEWKCVFAPVRPTLFYSRLFYIMLRFLQYTFQFIKMPLFILNSLYDTAQLNGILGLKCLPPNCDAEQMKFFDNFRTVGPNTNTLLYTQTLHDCVQQFLEQLAPARESSSTGIFGDSCLIHCQTLEDTPWATYAVGGQTMRETFEAWYFQTHADYKEVDGPFPDNRSCPVAKKATMFSKLFM